MVIVVVAQRQQVTRLRVRHEIGTSGLNELIDFIVAQRRVTSPFVNRVTPFSDHTDITKDDSRGIVRLRSRKGVRMHIVDIKHDVCKYGSTTTGGVHRLLYKVYMEHRRENVVSRMLGYEDRKIDYRTIEESEESVCG